MYRQCITRLQKREFAMVSLFPEYQQDRIDHLKGLPIIHHHLYVCDLPVGHRFPMRKFHKVYDFLVQDNVISRQQVVRPAQVRADVAECVHTSEYVDKFFNGKTSSDEQRATGFAWTEGLASRVRFETGGTLLAALLSLKRGMACSTAGGTHHAFPSRGAGFCLINDLAVTAQHLLNINVVSKILIVDLDVHQGDGTAYIFKDNDSVFTFSMHSRKNFPFRKQNSDLDIEFEDGASDGEFISTLTDRLPGIINSFRPDLILYDAGVDPHEADELGKLKLTDKGLFERDQYVFYQAIKHGIPVASVIGGGYSKDIDELAKRHTIVHRAAMKVWINHSL